MSEQSITLKTVADLRVDPESNTPLQFYIPAYQRGYRWSSLQVTQRWMTSVSSPSDEIPSQKNLLPAATGH
jgi:uncharacterized protein with ParB-like and HNH nuclease domain